MFDDVCFQQLNCWLDFCLFELFVVEGWGEVFFVELILVSSDVSFCCYFCWQGGDCSLVVMDVLLFQEDC